MTSLNTSNPDTFEGKRDSITTNYLIYKIERYLNQLSLRYSGLNIIDQMTF